MAQEEKSIIRSLLDPTLTLDEISFEDVEEGTSVKQDGVKRGEKVQQQMGDVYPLIKINDYTIAKDELEKMVIDTTGFIPEIYIKFTMGSSPNVAVTQSIPKDGDRMNVFVKARNDAFKPIRNDYLITNVETTKGADAQGHGSSIIVYGELFIPTFNDEIITSYNGTTFDVLQQIAEKLELGFASNEAETDDEQTWICANDNYKNFIKHICSSSWKDENSFFKCFIDVYYHLNFINVNNQFSDSIEIDDALIDTLTSTDAFESEKSVQTKGKKIFSNAKGYAGTNNFIQNFRLINQSSETAKRYGYKMHCQFFEQNTLNSWDIFSEPLIVSGSADEKILLKGKAGEDFYKTQIKKRWAGLQYSLPEHNVHEKFLYARIHNLINNAELEKLKVEMHIARANFNIYRGERIPCIFMTTGDIPKAQAGGTPEEEEEGGEFKAAGRPVLDKFISGFFMIHGMTFTYNTRNPDDPENRGNFIERVTVTRRAWPTPV
jgi:hypothetical protein